MKYKILAFVLFLFSLPSFAVHIGTVGYDPSGAPRTVVPSEAALKSSLKNGTYIMDKNGQAFVKSVKIEGYAAGAFKEKIPLTANIGSKVGFRAVASKALGWIGVAYMIGEPLIHAGFQYLEDKDDPDGGKWTKPTNGNRVYFTMPNCKQCTQPISYCKKKACLMADSPSGACPSGRADLYGDYFCTDDKGYSVERVNEGFLPAIPATNSELIDALVDNMGMGQTGDLASELQAQKQLEDSGITSGYAPNQSSTSSPYTPSSSVGGAERGVPQQTEIKTDSSGTPTVSYKKRPDLKPNSPEAPSTDYSPSTETGGDTGGTGGTGGKDKDKEKPDFDVCKAHPDILGCARYDDIPNGDIYIDEEDVGKLNSGRFNFQRTCPAPVVTEVWGQKIEFSYNPLCNAMGIIRPIVLALGSIVAFFMLTGGRKNG